MYYITRLIYYVLFSLLVSPRHWYSYSCVLPKWIQVIKIALLPERLILSKLYCSQPNSLLQQFVVWPLLQRGLLLAVAMGSHASDRTLPDHRKWATGGTQDSYLFPPLVRSHHTYDRNQQWVPDGPRAVPEASRIGGSRWRWSTLVSWRWAARHVGSWWMWDPRGLCRAPEGGSTTKEDTPTWWWWAPPGRCRWMPRDKRYRTWGWEWRKKSKQIPQFEIRNLLIGGTRSDHQMTFRRLIIPRSRLPTTT